MNLETKALISRWSLSLLILVIALVCLGALVVILCAGLDVNPFRETTTTLLIAFFVGLIGIAAALFLLNVATNISMTAEAGIAGLKIEPRAGVLKKWALGFGAAALALVVLILAGTYFSRYRYLDVVQEQANEVLKENDNLLAEISQRLASGQPADFKRILEIHNFLMYQRNGLPNMTIIYSAKFGDKQALYYVGGQYYWGGSETDHYQPQYFGCTRNLDCDYLKAFFSGEKVDVLKKFTIRGSQFNIYVPYTGKEARFVLMFDSRNNYGKIGS
ncbi:MAG TPA: hypothetical protein VJW20_12275 [Candidatus Angelobacter sp.]|nr:hypothetical protein [Candidatus Angelobacter sp.]